MGATISTAAKDTAGAVARTGYDAASGVYGAATGAVDAVTGGVTGAAKSFGSSLSATGTTLSAYMRPAHNSTSPVDEKAIARRIDDMTKLLDKYGTYNIRDIVGFIDKYSKESNVRLGTDLRNSILKYHQNTSAWLNYNKIDADEKLDATVKAKLAGLQTIASRNLGDENLNTLAITFFKNFVKLRRSYRFHEYSYVNLSLFMLSFVAHTYVIMTRIQSDIKSYHETQSKEREILIKEFMSVARTYIDNGKFDSDPRSSEKISASIAQLSQNVNLLKQRIAEEQKQLSTQPLEQMLTTILKLDPTLKNETTRVYRERNKRTYPQQQRGGFVRAGTIPADAAALA
jgi:hypothetical protein